MKLAQTILPRIYPRIAHKVLFIDVFILVCYTVLKNISIMRRQPALWRNKTGRCPGEPFAGWCKTFPSTGHEILMSSFIEQATNICMSAILSKFHRDFLLPWDYRLNLSMNLSLSSVWTVYIYISVWPVVLLVNRRCLRIKLLHTWYMYLHKQLNKRDVYRPNTVRYNPIR